MGYFLTTHDNHFSVKIFLLQSVGQAIGKIRDIEFIQLNHYII